MQGVWGVRVERGALADGAAKGLGRAASVGIQFVWSKQQHAKGGLQEARERNKAGPDWARVLGLCIESVLGVGPLGCAEGAGVVRLQAIWHGPALQVACMLAWGPLSGSRGLKPSSQVFLCALTPISQPHRASVPNCRCAEV